MGNFEFLCCVTFKLKVKVLVSQFPKSLKNKILGLKESIENFCFILYTPCKLVGPWGSEKPEITQDLCSQEFKKVENTLF